MPVSLCSLVRIISDLICSWSWLDQHPSYALLTIVMVQAIWLEETTVDKHSSCTVIYLQTQLTVVTLIIKTSMFISLFEFHRIHTILGSEGVRIICIFV